MPWEGHGEAPQDFGDSICWYRAAAAAKDSICFVDKNPPGRSDDIDIRVGAEIGSGRRECAWQEQIVCVEKSH